jgi:stage IV sporulation protein FB
MIRFSLFGIPVVVQPFFWLSLIILGAAGGADTSAEVFQILLFVLAGFISILVHEFGHALTARGFGANTAITLEAFGGYAAYSGVRMSRLRSFLITAAGPAVQIALGLVGMLVLLGLSAGGYQLSENGRYFLAMLVNISIIWAVINLLPILPLDGGQMLNSALGPARFKITLWVSVVVGITAAIFCAKAGAIIFAIFLGMYVWQAIQGLKENRWL